MSLSSKFTPKRVAKIIQLLRDGHGRSAVAARVGISRHTLSTWVYLGDRGDRRYAKFAKTIVRRRVWTAAHYERAIAMIRRGETMASACRSLGFATDSRLPPKLPAVYLRLLKEAIVVGDVIRAKRAAKALKASPTPARQVRTPQPQRASATKLCAEDVIAIRQKIEERISIRKLAAMFGVSKSTVGNIVTRDTWKHLPGPRPDYIRLRGHSRK